MEGKGKVTHCINPAKSSVPSVLYLSKVGLPTQIRAESDTSRQRENSI